MLVDFLEIVFLGFFSIFFATGFFYECMCLLLRTIVFFDPSPRRLLYILITGIFIAHGLTIIFYSLVYWSLVHILGFEELSGLVNDHYLSYLYYSATTYSSLGVGDIFSSGRLRFITGLEAINGLILITWSATIAYFSIQKMWKEHDIKYRL